MVDELNTTPDADLEAIVAKGERAREILEERSRQATRAERAKQPLTIERVMAYAQHGSIGIGRDKDGNFIKTFYDVPFTEILAAAPFPEGLTYTYENTRRVLHEWLRVVQGRDDAG